MAQSRATPCTTDQWYVAQCKPLKEWEAAAALEKCLELVVYLPALRRYRGKKLQQTPFFPCYLFVNVDLRAVSLSRINSTPGVVRLLTIDDLPQPVPSTLVEAIRQRLDSFNVQGSWAEHDFQAGDSVQVRDGPLKGLDAIFVGPSKANERVRVLIELLGRLNRVEVDVRVLERSATQSPHAQGRRTRGKGRWIRNAANDPACDSVAKRF